MAKISTAIITLIGVSCLCQVATAVTSQELNRVLAATGYRQVNANLAGVIANGINGMTSDRNEVAMFLAQVIYESAGFHYREEIGGASKKYAPYYGRGYIQLTWDYNYRAASRDIFGDERLMRDPGLVAIWGNPKGGSSNPVSIKRYEMYKQAAKVLGVTNVGINRF
ncbi:hypothetical protein quinque_011535 [Culex quinquefasciatus]